MMKSLSCCLTSPERSTEHIWREQDGTSTGFCRGLAPRRKGAGSGLVLDFTARERDCNGCLRESRAKLACSVKKKRLSVSQPPGFFCCCFFFAEGTGKERGGGGGLMPLSPRESHRLQIRESTENFEKSRRRGEIQLRGSTSSSSSSSNSSSSSPRGPGGGVNRSQVLPSTCH